MAWSGPARDSATGRDLKTGKVVSSNKLQQELVTAGHHHRCYRNKATDATSSRATADSSSWTPRATTTPATTGSAASASTASCPPTDWSTCPPTTAAAIPKPSSTASGPSGPSRIIDRPAVPAPQQHPSRRARLRGSRPEAGIHRGPGRRLAHPPSRSRPQRGHADAAGHRLGARLESGWRRATLRPGDRRRRAARRGAGQSPGPRVRLPQPAPKSGVSRPVVRSTRRPRSTATAPCSARPTAPSPACGWRMVNWSGASAPRPLDRRTVALQQVESLWPVHGSILVKDGTAYFTAGRSTYLDGGMFLYGLDPATGAIKYRQASRQPPAGAPETGRKHRHRRILAEQGRLQDPSGARTTATPSRWPRATSPTSWSPTITRVYLRHMKFDSAWERSIDPDPSPVLHFAPARRQRGPPLALVLRQRRLQPPAGRLRVAHPRQLRRLRQPGRQS